MNKMGLPHIEQDSILKAKPISSLGTPVELVRAFGKKSDFEQAINELESEIYNIA